MKDLSFLKSSLIAHRGIHDFVIRENSLDSFKKAIALNYIIEFDVHLTNDNVVVVFHDDNLKRIIGVDKNIKDCNYEELKKYDIPSLDDTLNLIHGKVPIILELKYDCKVGLLEKEVAFKLDNYKGKFCVKSFSPLSVRWFKKNRPNYIRGLLISERNKTIKEKILHSVFVYYFCKPDFISCNYKLFMNKKIKRYMKKIPVIAWTIRNNDDYLLYKNIFYNLIVENVYRKF